MTQAVQNGPQDRVRRILVIDDNDATHDDFRKILVRRETVLDGLEEALFGGEAHEAREAFEIDSAFQGQEGLEMARQASLEGRPYELAFVDLRMPPGWDGFETITRLWESDPLLQIVLCAAFLGCTHKEVIDKLGRSEGLAILEKPFEPAEVLDLARAMTEQCWRARQGQLAPQR
jgi:CheY-like chemotaxis protein